MTAPAVLCEGLVRIFRTADVEVQALQGLDLRLERGELVAMVGASGSGKSTLLGILSGLDVPTAGRAEVAGVDLTEMRGARRVRYQRETVGFVWQQTSRNLLPYLTAAENVALPLLIARVKAPERTRRAGELLELLGVADRAGDLPQEMSGGEQQRVALARALVKSPRLVLADEPTGNLDAATGDEIGRMLRSYSRERAAIVILATHNAQLAAACDRTLVLEGGKIS